MIEALESCGTMLRETFEGVDIDSIQEVQILDLEVQPEVRRIGEWQFNYKIGFELCSPGRSPPRSIHLTICNIPHFMVQNTTSTPVVVLVLVVAVAGQRLTFLHECPQLEFS